MTIFKEGDKVRIRHGAYNVADHRWGREATVDRIDAESIHLPVRIEHDTPHYSHKDFNWTNFESLELIEAAPVQEQHAEIGKDILDRMLALKEAIVIRDNAVKDVVERTEALDALLASVGLKRSEEAVVTAAPTTAPRTAFDDVSDRLIEEGYRYKCESDNFSYFSEGEVYTVTNLDYTDNSQPISFEDDDGDDYYPQRHELKHFIRVTY